MPRLYPEPNEYLRVERSDAARAEAAGWRFSVGWFRRASGLEWAWYERAPQRATPPVGGVERTRTIYLAASRASLTAARNAVSSLLANATKRSRAT